MENNDLLIFKVTNNKKPIIFSDVDGTLYNDFNILDETKKDISFAQKIWQILTFAQETPFLNEC